MTYAEKLKDPRWQKRRLEILQRDGFACTECYDANNTLHVHHLKYHNDPWDSPADELKTLCENCHTELEQTLKELPKIIIDACRLKINDSFVMGCLKDLFICWDDLHGLIYLLWELRGRQEKVDAILTELFRAETSAYQNAINEILNAEN